MEADAAEALAANLLADRPGTKPGEGEPSVS